MELELYNKANALVNEIAELNRVKGSILRKIANLDLKAKAQESFSDHAILQGKYHALKLIDTKIEELNLEFGKL